jgi:hypothetical protein
MKSRKKIIRNVAHRNHSPAMIYHNTLTDLHQHGNGEVLPSVDLCFSPAKHNRKQLYLLVISQICKHQESLLPFSQQFLLHE